MGFCAACAGELRALVPYRFKSRAFAKVYRGGHVFACASCGLKQADMAQVDGTGLDAYYRTVYRQTGIAGKARPDTYPARAESILQDAAQMLATQPRRVFEVGAGHGYNLAAIGAAYPEAALFTDEIDESVALPDRIRSGRLDDGGFDLVILSHVLEHFTDPAAILGEAHRSLAPGGVVIVEVPNEMPQDLAGQAHHEPHLTFFERDTLRAMASAIDPAADVFTVGPRSGQPSALKGIKRMLRKTVHALQGTAAPLRTIDYRRRDGGRFLRAHLPG